MLDKLSDIFDEAYLDSLIAWFMTSGLRILVVVICAFALLRLLNVLIGRLERLVLKDESEFTSALETEKRVRTVSNLAGKTTHIAIFIIAFMMVLREIGINIAPIIAGAGIVGLAVGFGAQNLVRDIISGFFIIIENQVRVGDVAVINGTDGLVEEINLRTIVMRDMEGTVHVFPNGTITTLANKSKGWSRYVIDVGVAYKENVDYVMEVLKDIGEKLSKDEKFGPMILEPLEVLGVDNFGSSDVIIKCMVKTQPLKQWDVGRELRRRIKNTFDEKGIEIPFPHLSVHFGETSKPFEVDINQDADPESIFNDRGYELIKRMAEKRGSTVDKVLSEVVGKIRESGKDS